jgi:hypothetical protein
VNYGGIEMLVGAKMVLATELAGDLYFLTDRGLYVGRPYGDCCASCYVQHIEGTWALAKGATIASVEGIELPPVPQEEQNDVSDVWGHRITTDKGVCTIEMRVDHNGYYGGSLNFDGNQSWPNAVHADCAEHPELGIACGCLKVLDDY